MWFLFAIAGGSLQAVRNAVSKGLSARVSAPLNSWARFAFNLPWACACTVLVSWDEPSPRLSLNFFLACLVAGIAQLLANIALVSAFRYTTFAESIVLNKLEVVFTALVGVAFFAEVPSVVGWGGMVMCMVGAVAIHLGHGAASRAGGGSERTRLLRLAPGPALSTLAAALLVVASFAVKYAINALAADNPWAADEALVLPAHTLLHVTWIEVVILTLTLLMQQRAAFQQVPANVFAMAHVGLFAFASSLCWYMAFASGLVAYVRAVGQVEVAWSVLIGLWLFRERQAPWRLVGTALVTAGVLLVLLAAVE